MTAYDPGWPIEDTGLPPLKEVAGALVITGMLDEAAAERLITQIDEAGRSDRMLLSLTMYAVSGTAP